MDRDELIRRLMTTFLGELDEHVAALNRDLLALERQAGAAGGTELVNTLFRTAHSLKGAARSVDVGPVEAVCHRLETIFAAVRDGTLAPDPALFATMFATADAIADAGRRLGAGEGLDAGALEALVSRLEAAVTNDASATVPGRRMPAPAPASSAPALPPPPPAAEAPAGSGPSLGPAGDGFVRVPVAKLDALLALSGELMIARRRGEAHGGEVARLLEMVKRVEFDGSAKHGSVARAARRSEAPVGPAAGGRTASPGAASPRVTTARPRGRDNLRWLGRGLDDLERGLARDHRLLEQVAAPLEAGVLRARMVPVAEACGGLDRMVRDLALSAGKEAELVVEGGEIEVDRSVLESLRDPLMHLVRNAVDHGIEAPEARLAAGKPRPGRITVSATLRGGRVEIAVADDGQGLDAEAIRRQARKRSLAEPNDERGLADLVFRPGFSTSRMITAVSGRGVGLDVVKTAVESRRGTVALAFTPGRGTRFVLAVPLTLTLLRALLVTAGGQTYAFDSANVRTLARVGTAELGSMEGREVLVLDGPPVPVVALAEALGAATPEPPRHGTKLPVVVLAAGDERMAFTVDELVAEQEVVVKGLGSRLKRVRNVIGATVLATGRIALILNAAELIRTARDRAPARTLAAALTERVAEARKRLLLVEDSVTTRALEKSILEAAGYEVATATNGMEAWQTLQQEGADLVVSDIEMPRMDGFALTEAIRASKRFRDLPVILVTAMETDQDKARGMDAGADAYLLKSAFDQRNLLATIAQLL